MLKLFQAAAVLALVLVLALVGYLLVRTPPPRVESQTAVTAPKAGAKSAAPVTGAPANYQDGAIDVILTTTLGPLNLKLWPKLAPQHVAQFVKIVKAGVLDASALIRIEKNFVIQFGGTFGRPNPLTPEQEAVVVKIPAEFSDVKHVRGTLSMARNADVNSADTSFSVLLGPAPHLNGQYTVFGAIDPTSEDTLRQLEAQPVVPGTTKPQSSILITKATASAF